MAWATDSVRYCSSCGGGLSPGVAFCPRCGTKVQAPPGDAASQAPPAAVSAPGEVASQAPEAPVPPPAPPPSAAQTVGAATAPAAHSPPAPAQPAAGQPPSPRPVSGKLLAGIVAAAVVVAAIAAIIVFSAGDRGVEFAPDPEGATSPTSPQPPADSPSDNLRDLFPSTAGAFTLDELNELPEASRHGANAGFRGAYPGPGGGATLDLLAFPSDGDAQDYFEFSVGVWTDKGLDVRRQEGEPVAIASGELDGDPTGIVEFHTGSIGGTVYAADADTAVDFLDAYLDALER